jgi:hypothetical protein
LDFWLTRDLKVYINGMLKWPSTPEPMARPLDIRIAFQPGTGFMAIGGGQVLNMANLGSDAGGWTAALVLTAQPSSNGNVHMEVQMNGAVNANPKPERELADLFLQQQMEGCAPPTDGSECCFCLGSQPEQVWVKLRTCEHTFHRHCIEPWPNPICPLCRGDLTRNTRRRMA